MQLLHIAPGQMWWLITCAGLTGSWGAQTLGQTLLMMMMMSVRVFVDETDIWIGRLSEADCLQPCGWASSNQLKPWIEQNAEPPAWEKKPSSCLPLSWGIRVFFFFFLLPLRSDSYWNNRSSWIFLLVFRLEPHHQFPWVSSLLTEDLGTCQPS